MHPACHLSLQVGSPGVIGFKTISITHNAYIYFSSQVSDFRAGSQFELKLREM